MGLIDPLRIQRKRPIAGNPWILQAGVRTLTHQTIPASSTPIPGSATSLTYFDQLINMPGGTFQENDYIYFRGHGIWHVSTPGDTAALVVNVGGLLINTGTPVAPDNANRFHFEGTVMLGAISAAAPAALLGFMALNDPPIDGYTPDSVRGVGVVDALASPFVVRVGVAWGVGSNVLDDAMLMYLEAAHVRSNAA